MKLPDSLIQTLILGLSLTAVTTASAQSSVDADVEKKMAILENPKNKSELYSDTSKTKKKSEPKRKTKTKTKAKPYIDNCLGCGMG